tara:strand:+ start:131 stop:1564 length:1434 start_codon:yes stop_codon:yes gene_type:complete
MLSVKDKRVLDFYKTHSYIDFEQANILLVEMLERLLQKNDDNRDDIVLQSLKKLETGFSSLSNNLSEVKDNVKQSSLSIVNLQTAVTTLPNSMTDNLSNKFSSLRETQVKELERIFDLNKHSSAEHIDKKLKIELMDQIKSLLDTNMNKKLETSLNEFERTLKKEWQETIKQLERSDSPKHIIDTFNSSLQLKCDSLQSFILTCHEQTKDTTTSHTETLNLVRDHFDRQKNSTHKGADSEDKVLNGLYAAFPDCQVTKTTGIAKAGDFLIERSNNTPIMIENKDYVKNVPKEEIEKFIRDIEHQGCNGILVSQTSGIARKKNFQIDIHNRHIIIFIHCLKYDFDKIRLAIETIDHLSKALNNYSNNTNELKLSSETLKEINKEYLAFITQKAGLSDSLKKYNKDMTKLINELQFPELSNMLSQYFSSTEETIFKCEYCKVKIFKNSKALAKHIQTCKPKYDKCMSVDTVVNDDSSDD